MKAAPDGAFLSRTELYLFAAASAVVTASAYYIHPIISVVAEDFGISAAMIGLVPALNQIALALGIFLLLPLGDRVSNKRLISIFVAGQFACICVMALARDYWLFVAGSTLLGFVTIAPYLLPAYVSKRVPSAKLGKSTAVLTVGIIAGILVARAGAGVIAEHFGWRSVYYVAAALMLCVTFMLPLIMEPAKPGKGQDKKLSYLELIFSTFPLARRYPEIILTGTIQAMSFGVFLSVWMGLGLHLTSPQMGYGVDVVGYLALFSLINLLTTASLGAWADRVGARKARLVIATVQIFGVSLLFFTGHSLWLLMVPIVLMNVAGPVIDVTNRMTFLNQSQDVRTRLMTIYIIFMFVGGGIASWAGTAAYDWLGWQGNAALAFGLSAVTLLISWVSVLKHGTGKA
jgi:predicted MFS family arabinose efflux permease